MDASDDPRRKTIERSQCKPHNQESQICAERRDDRHDWLPRAPTRFEVGTVELDSPAGWVGQSPAAEKRTNIATPFAKLHSNVRRQVRLSCLPNEHHKSKKAMFCQWLTRDPGRVEFLVDDLPLRRKFMNCRANRRIPGGVQKPNDRSRHD